MNYTKLLHTSLLTGLVALLAGCGHQAEMMNKGYSLLDAGPTALERIPDSSPDRFREYVGTFKSIEPDPTDVRPVVLCIGSSSFRMWKAQEAMPEYKVYNFGFGGSQFSDVNALWDELSAPEEPDFVLIYEGDNDIAVGKSSLQVYEDFLETMGRVQAAYPDAMIIIVPVKPSPTRVQFWEEACKLNKALVQYAEGNPRVRMVQGIAEGVLDEDGLPIDALYRDGVHFNEEGYHIWNERILAALAQAAKQ